MNFSITSKNDTNPLESMFGVVRGMDEANVDPNGMYLLIRLKRVTVSKALK